jgi:predicted Zn finger-like uncharacterized protein
MRLVCPACETAYDVPETALRAGRAFRCALCRYEWVPVAGEPVEMGAALPAPLDEAPAPLARTPQPMFAADKMGQDKVGQDKIGQDKIAQDRAGPRAEVVAAWFLTLLLLAAGIAESIYWRQSIIRAWPASERAYALLGYQRGD